MQPAEVDLDDGHGIVAEPPLKMRGSGRVQLDSDDAGASEEERMGERPGPGADVDHEVTRRKVSLVDDPLSPSVVKPMPAPLGSAVLGRRPPCSALRPG